MHLQYVPNPLFHSIVKGNNMAAATQRKIIEHPDQKAFWMLRWLKDDDTRPQPVSPGSSLYHVRSLNCHQPGFLGDDGSITPLNST